MSLWDALKRTPGDTRERKPADEIDPDTPPDAPDSGFVGEPYRRRGAQVSRGALYAVLGVIFLAGVDDAVVGPATAMLDDPPPPRAAPVEGIPHGEAARLAVGYTADLFTWNADTDEDVTASMAQWMGDEPTALWSGSNGALYADMVTPGEVVDDGPDRSLVKTTARVSTPGQDRLVWLSLLVVVERDDDTDPHVAAATFHGDTPVALQVPQESTDSDLSNETRDVAEDLLTAVATGETAFVTTPHVQLAGLAGAVELADLSSWTVVQGDGDTRYGTATVTWRLTGSELQLKQELALRIQNVDGRWLLDSYGPALEG